MRPWWILGMLGLLGCASTPEVVNAPPVAEDLVGWSTATTVPEEPEPRGQATAAVDPAKARSPREKVYAYKPEDCYGVEVSVGRPLRVMLQAGEEIHNVADGDRSRLTEQESERPWQVVQGYIGAGKTGRPVLLITVPAAGLQNGIDVTTTRRAYCLEAKSVVKSPVRSIRWTYDDEPRVMKPPKPRLLPDPTQPQRFHAGYLICPGDERCDTSQPRPIWAVRHVVDNGAKTFLIFPPTLGTMEAPLVRSVGVNGPELLNTRMVGSVLVIDRIINRLELRLGSGKTAEVVTVQREQPITIDCPGDVRCPVWPHGSTVSREGQP